jgi:vancomycin permeability regulator SanA
MKTKFLKLNWKKLVLCLAVICLAGLVLFFAINGYVKSVTRERILSPEEAAGLQADCILILGTGVQSNGTPSPMLQDRLVQGLALYELGASERLLMSGDHGRENYDEVNVMKKFAIDSGVPSQCVFMDHAGFSTYESLYRARDVFQADKLIIVTQEYHLYRALYVASSLGLDAFGVAAEPVDYAGQEYREMREMLARVKDFFNVIVAPKPTFLGEAIPVGGNGDVTND